MSDEPGHPQHHHPAGPPPEAPVEDAGSQALAEALRSSFGIVKFVMVILVGVFLCSGLFMVGPQERAIILRLGAPPSEGTNALLGPGLHWAFPAPIDEVKRIPYAAIQTVTSRVGWYRITPEEESAGQKPQGAASLNPEIDGYVITADGNVIHTRASLSYRVEEPIKYAFGFSSASNTLRDDLDNALLFAASRFTVDDILTTNQLRFREAVLARVVALAQDQNLGIAVEQCEVASVPPLFLQKDFDDVNGALTRAEDARNNSRKIATDILTLASSAAATLTNSAENDRVRLVESVNKEAEAFSNMLPTYQRDRALTLNILLYTKLSEVLTNVQDTYFIQQRPDGAKQELRLLLNQAFKPPVQAPPPIQ